MEEGLPLEARVPRGRVGGEQEGLRRDVPGDAAGDESVSSAWISSRRASNALAGVSDAGIAAAAANAEFGDPTAAAVGSGCRGSFEGVIESVSMATSGLPCASSRPQEANPPNVKPSLHRGKLMSRLNVGYIDRALRIVLGVSLATTAR